jgi:LysR family transcriptional regulator, regulator for bpeEF and oprC
VKNGADSRIGGDIMDRLQAMQVFTRIVEMNSFSRAAESMNLPHASASTIIKNLEAYLRVRLMQRTTRRLNLTPEGAEYYGRCVRILTEIEETEHSMSNTGRGPTGKLRIDMPASIGKMIVMPQISDFRDRYPDIDLMIGFGDKPVDLIQERVDCAIRVGALADSSLVVRTLGELQTVTVASPEYLARFGQPSSIDDLQHHEAAHYFSSRSGRILDMTFVDGKELKAVKLRGSIAVNDAEAYVNCGIDGVGLIQPPRFMVRSHLDSGALVEVLSHWKTRSLPIAAVYSQNQYLSQKVRIFVEWASVLFDSCALPSSAKASVEGSADNKEPPLYHYENRTATESLEIVV